MRSLHVIGDSISIQYGPYLEDCLAGRVAYSRKGSEDAAMAAALRNLDMPSGANGGDSSMVLDWLRQRCADPAFRPDLLLLNCGLHDIKRAVPGNELQVPLAAYLENLVAITTLLAGRGTDLCWVRTTPVNDERHNSRSKQFHRHAADLAEYNTTADAVMASSGVRSIDLHAFSARLGDEAFIDHVHFSVPARREQAAFIAGHVLAWLG
jgi:hypothetical protein